MRGGGCDAARARRGRGKARVRSRSEGTSRCASACGKLNESVGLCNRRRAEGAGGSAAGGRDGFERAWVARQARGSGARCATSFGASRCAARRGSDVPTLSGSGHTCPRTGPGHPVSHHIVSSARSTVAHDDVERVERSRLVGVDRRNPRVPDGSADQHQRTALGARVALASCACRSGARSTRSRAPPATHGGGGPVDVLDALPAFPRRPPRASAVARLLRVARRVERPRAPFARVSSSRLRERLPRRRRRAVPGISNGRRHV